MRDEGWLLFRQWQKPLDTRKYEGTVAVKECDTRWCSGGLELSCDNGLSRWHQSLKNCVLLEHYYLPGDLEQSMDEFVAALTMAVWRRKPNGSVIIHSDQGTQFGSDEFSRWCKDNRLSPSMSRRGNCWDNAVAESFFSSLKSERVKKRIYSTRAEAKSDIFDYIEGFYNRVRRHKHLDQLSPLEFVRRPLSLVLAWLRKKLDAIEVQEKSLNLFLNLI